MLNHSPEAWDHFLVLLGKMQGVFRQFLSLLGEEERLLLGMDRQGVADITEKKEQVLEGMCSIRTASHGDAGTARRPGKS